MTSFDQFWPHYLREHGSGANRALHVAGTAAALAMLAAGVVRRRPKLVLLAPVVAYGAAWAGHFLIERNRPATFANPLWSVRADLKMLALATCGRLRGELGAAARAARRPPTAPRPNRQSTNGPDVGDDEPAPR